MRMVLTGALRGPGCRRQTVAGERGCGWPLSCRRQLRLEAKSPASLHRHRGTSVLVNTCHFHPALSYQRQLRRAANVQLHFADTKARAQPDHVTCIPLPKLALHTCPAQGPSGRLSRPPFAASAGPSLYSKLPARHTLHQSLRVQAPKRPSSQSSPLV